MNKRIFLYWILSIVFAMLSFSVHATDFQQQMTLKRNVQLKNMSFMDRGEEQGELLSNPPSGDSLMVRIAEIEIDPVYLNEYKEILKTEAAASIKLEPGVIAILPMFQQEKPNQVRILEVYANKAAYQAHLQSPHFLIYKTSTLKMVKSLQLIQMTALDIEILKSVLKKLD